MFIQCERSFFWLFLNVFFSSVSVRGFQSRFCENQLKRMNLSLGKKNPDIKKNQEIVILVKQ